MATFDKAELRRRIRAAYPGEAQRNAESEALCRHVLAWQEYRQAVVVGAYVPMKREADVTPILRDALMTGKTLLLPRVESEGQMTFRRVRDLTSLVVGAYGLLEPGEREEVADPVSLDVLIVPIEGIDRHGLRLGKGGGYYDRMLGATHCRTIGAVMSWQWVSSVPRESWDQALEMAVDCEGIHCFAE